MTERKQSPPPPGSIDLILPCLNEAAALPQVLADLPAGVRAIVVDNGSSDDTAAVARSWGATVITEARPGFGSAVHAGVLVASAELVAVCDADGSFDLAQLPRVTEPVAAGSADLVLGCRHAVSRESWLGTTLWANRVLTALIRMRTGLRLRDLGPMRAMRRETLMELQLVDRRSGYPLEMVLRAHERGLRIREVPVDFHPRVGESKVTGTARGTLNAIVDMSRLLRQVQQ